MAEITSNNCSKPPSSQLCWSPQIRIWMEYYALRASVTWSTPESGSSSLTWTRQPLSLPECGRTAHLICISIEGYAVSFWLFSYSITTPGSQRKDELDRIKKAVVSFRFLGRFSTKQYAHMSSGATAALSSLLLGKHAMWKNYSMCCTLLSAFYRTSWKLHQLHGHVMKI